MKVSELIEILKNYSQDSTVMITTGYGSIEADEIYDDGVGVIVITGDSTALNDE